MASEIENLEKEVERRRRSMERTNYFAYEALFYSRRQKLWDAEAKLRQAKGLEPEITATEKLPF